MKKHLWVCGLCLAVVLLTIWVVSPCLGDDGDSSTNPGDPYEIPPMKTLKPTSSTLSEFWMILVAMAFQFAF
jgi:hypothetical protein